MPSDRYFGDLRKQREEWKRARLQGPYTPEQVDYRRYRRKRRTDGETEADEEPSSPPELPLQPRFEGMWVVGLPGTGKTQLFQYLLMRDLDTVARGEASVVILDPTGIEPGTLIRTVTRLKRFAPGGDLYGNSSTSTRPIANTRCRSTCYRSEPTSLTTTRSAPRSAPTCRSWAA